MPRARGGSCKRATPLLLALALGCASTSEPAAIASTSADKDEGAHERSAAKNDDEAPEPGPPTTWAEARERYEFKCPAPSFTLAAPRRVVTKAATFLIEGSVARREGVDEEVVIGVLGALKDAAPETRENVKKAARIFAAAGVDVVLSNGDLGEDRELEEVFAMLGEELSVPVLVHSGNMEWTSAFVRAMGENEKKHPQLINLNWIAHVELGSGVHLLSLPGYHDLQFLKPGGCRYSDDDVERVTALARELRARGDIVIVSSHGPPLQDGPRGLDVAYDDAGHVGDERLTKLLQDGDVSVGIFSHILESGGRATTDARGREPVSLPVKKPLPKLYLNAGSASAFGWKLLDGKTSEGTALVVVVSKAGAMARQHALR